jgi:hypothetical protein
MVSFEFFIDIILPAALWPWTSIRNISCGGGGGGGCKRGRCVWLTTLPPSSADCLVIWEPQPPGNLRACTGIAVTHYSNCIMHYVALARLQQTFYKAVSFLKVKGKATCMDVAETPAISRQSAHDSSNVFSPKQWPLLPTRRYPYYSFLLEDESTPGP